MAIFKDKIKTKDGRSWYFKVYKKDFSGKNKAYKSKRYLTKKEAQEEEATFLLKRETKSNIKLKYIALDYFKYAEDILKKSTYDTNYRDYYNHIAPYFDETNIFDITPQNIIKWREELKKCVYRGKHYSIRFLNKLNNIFSVVLDYAISRYGLHYNPIKMAGVIRIKKDEIITNDKKIRYMTFDDFEKFISIIENDMWKTFFMFLYYTGMRKGEVIALKWNDISKDYNYVSVSKTLYDKIKGTFTVTSTKNNQNREVQLSKNIKDQIINYHQKVKKYTDYSDDWYIFGNTIHLPTTTIDRYKNMYCDKAQINRITIHEFRHSHVSLCANEYIKQCRNNNVKIDTYKFFLIMSNRMGHTIPVMQETYMHLFPTVQDEVIDLLNNL